MGRQGVSSERYFRRSGNIYPICYFDGASVGGRCGCGVSLHIDQSISFGFFWFGGLSDNSQAEMLGLWGALQVAQQLCFDSIWVVDDSLSTIGWIQDSFAIQIPTLHNWMKHIFVLKALFSEVTFQHSYREHNYKTDSLKASSVS